MKKTSAPLELKNGYYTVHIQAGLHRIPYTVYAESDYHAARQVREETGYLAQQDDVEGPFLAADLRGDDARPLLWGN